MAPKKKKPTENTIPITNASIINSPIGIFGSNGVITLLLPL